MPECHYCSRPVDTGEAIVLWDGEPHCLGCVAAVEPGLAEYARTHADLAETQTADGLRLRRVFLHPITVALSLGLLVPTIVILYVTFTKSGLPIWSGLCCQGVFLAFWAVCIGVLSWKWYFEVRRRSPRTIRFANGELVIEYTVGDWWSVPLGECDWYPGYTSETEATITLPRAPAVIVLVPTRRTAIALGLTTEMYRVWSGFLTLAGAPSRGRLPWYRLLVWCAVGVPVGIGLGVALGWPLKEVMGDEQLLHGLGLLGAFDGLFIPLSVLFTGWEERPRGGERWKFAGPLPLLHSSGASRLTDRWARWRSVGRSTLMFGLLGLLAASPRRGVELGLLSRLAVITANTCLGFCLGWWVSRRSCVPGPAAALPPTHP